MTAIGTDNARIVTAAGASLAFEHMPWMAHTLHLSVYKAVDETGIDAILSKCRKILGRFKYSPANAKELAEKQTYMRDS